MGSLKGQCKNCQKQFSCAQERGECEGFAREELDEPDLLFMFVEQQELREELQF